VVPNSYIVLNVVDVEIVVPVSSSVVLFVLYDVAYIVLNVVDLLVAILVLNVVVVAYNV